MNTEAPLQEQHIIAALFYDGLFLKKVLPHLKEEYFQTDHTRNIVRLIKAFVLKYNTAPTPDAIAIDLQNENGLNEAQFKAAAEYLGSITKPNADHEWLVDLSEKYCQDRAIYIGIMQSIQILDDKNNGKSTKGLSRGAIPTILADALSTSFDRSIGHDYVMEAENRWDFYHNKDIKVPFDIDMLNRITKDGVARKTLTVLVAAPGVGKTLAMCHMAAHNFISGLNVLYITMEMADKMIAQRVDANLLDVDINDLDKLSNVELSSRMERLKRKMPGQLVIKEFATGAANASHFRHLLTELSMKKHFVPQIIYVDYLNICSSSRYVTKDANSYMIVKAIAEELRGIAVEYDVPVITATQFNRAGASSSDPHMTDTSDSFGTPMTADLQLALLAPEELQEEHKIVVKQLKNRYGPVEEHRRFLVGVDKIHMRLINCDDAFDYNNEKPKNGDQSKPQIKYKQPYSNVDSSGFDFSQDTE